MATEARTSSSDITRTSQEIARAALEYAALGWRVVPLHAVMPDNSCSCGNRKCGKSTGKHPRLSQWQNHASADEETVADWWGQWPHANVGVQFGPASGLVDFETDNEDGERLLAELFGGEIPVTPMFRSGRGKHRLFKWRDDLPKKGTIPLGCADIKLGADGKGSQSVFPPSRHYSGVRYLWLVSPRDVEVAEIPDDAVPRIWNWDGLEFDGDVARKPKSHWQRLGAGLAEGEGRNAAATSIIGGLLRRIPSLDDEEGLEIVYQAAHSINQNNKPPLDDDEFGKVFASIVRREQQRRATEEADMVLARSPQQIVEDANKKGVKVPHGMKLVIVRDDPPAYELHAPQFSKARGGCIKLTAAQLCSFESIKVQALEQADYPLPAEFKKAWNAKGGLYEQLVFSAEERHVSAVTKRLAVAAEYLLSQLSAAKSGKDGVDEPDPRKARLFANGEVWFRWSETWKDAILSGTIGKEDPKRVAHALGMGENCVRFWPHHGTGRRRYVVFGKELMGKLTQLAEAADSEAQAIYGDKE